MANRNRDSLARPFSIRLTDSEKATLTARAAGVPLGVFARRILLGDQTQPRAARPRSPVAHGDLLARMLALLGQSAIASNLNQLVRHAESGSLLLDEATTRQLRQACEAMVAMRTLLLRALGKNGPSEASPPKRLSQAFGERASRPERL